MQLDSNSKYKSSFKILAYLWATGKLHFEMLVHADI